MIRLNILNALLVAATLALVAGVCLAADLAAQENPAAFMKKVLGISTFDANAESVLDPIDEQGKRRANVNEATRAEAELVKKMRLEGDKLGEALELADKLIKNLIAALETKVSPALSFNLQKLVGSLQYERILILKRQHEIRDALRESTKYVTLCEDLEICSAALANKLVSIMETTPEETKASLEDMLRKRRLQIDAQE